MTISIWRYSHLVLAISSFVFIVLASVTGIILAFQPISEQLKPYNVEDINHLSLAEMLGVFQKKYPEIIDIKVNENDFVIASVFTNDGSDLSGYFNPKTAEYLGEELKASPFFQWITNFHRSLFLKSVGRFFVGLCSFLLFLIALTGSILIIKRQRGLRRFFSKIVNEDFNQYWHVVLGRLSLIPILIITITGVYLSLEKFNALPEHKITHTVNFESLKVSPKVLPSEFEVFKSIKLSEVKRIEFPFSPEVEDYFTLKLHDKELLVNQLTGDVISNIELAKVEQFSVLSLNLHTGKGSMLWSIILAIATANILFFVYSGFAMTLKRRQAKLKNKFKANEATTIVLVGSENGSTITYANAFYRQLIAQGEKVFITEMNAFENYKKAKKLVVITATYGEGDDPTNADKFLDRLNVLSNTSDLEFSVVGFGSLAYPDFCKFAFDVDKALQQKHQQLLPVHTVNDKSIEAFNQWLNAWNNVTGNSISIPEKDLMLAPKRLKKFKVIDRTVTKDNPDDTFLITLQSKSFQQFTSGDLLAIYPKGDYRERLYSIGKVTGNVQLSVKLHNNGLGSGFINALEQDEVLKARLVKNTAFHFPKNASKVIMICNGTGIAPFLGMLSQNKSVETHLYFGLRTQDSFELYRSQIAQLRSTGQLSRLELATSREGEKRYVQDYIMRDRAFITESMEANAVIMICGSLAMYKAILKALEKVLPESTQYYLNNGQIKSDCY
ncbi:PepSY domain-containing protein [Seonamhaeicola marinus]|uniref:FAD-binding oxidoreductase n=1 Tax=Seonamhaeicola marinus TaxID=1912246 RepID=A0A5D0HSV9_9FLAO|nr:PepSY domain-containing protein [Seonamhaeicola marinus]TYA74355.1 FAD-binding oxidoreductase [Seonamhaeicola marinus]